MCHVQSSLLDGDGARGASQWLTHLQKHLEAVQWSCACSGDGPSHGSCHQLPPHHPRPPLPLRELVRDRQVLADVKHLWQSHTEQ